MAMLLSDLITECVDQIRHHYRIGHFDRAEAIARIKGTASVNDDQAAELLDQSDAVKEN